MITPIAPALMSINEFGAWSRLGRTKIYQEIGSGKLPVLKIGRRTYVRTADAQSWLESYADASAARFGSGR